MLQSPSSTLVWQAGNSYDLSVLLVSLLIGVGYDALCVSGYAQKRVTLNDQTSLVCPVLKEQQETTVNEKEEESNAYDKLIIPKYYLESKYLQQKDPPPVEIAKSQSKINVS